MPMTPPLLKRLGTRRSALGPASFAALLSLVLLTLAGSVGMGLHLPRLFPSLGPTVMLFFELFACTPSGSRTLPLHPSADSPAPTLLQAHSRWR